MYDAIDQAAAAGYIGVVFTGGEATLVLDVVLAGLARANAAGLGTRLVTNGHWARSDSEAKDVLCRLKSAGLHELNLSTGDQHARFVPLADVIRAASMALRVGFRKICIMVEVTMDSVVRAVSITSSAEYQRAVADYPGGQVDLIESPWMPTQYKMHTAYPEGYLLNSDNLAKKVGCDSCLRTTTVQADGRIAACCGLGIRTVPELYVGHIGSDTLVDADRKANDDFLKRWIHIDGPEKILAWAATKDPSIEWENLYAHKCQSCLRLYKDPKVRRVIVEHHLEKIPDVILGEFLLERFDPAGSSIPPEVSG